MNLQLQPNRYRELDALRGIAALMVVMFHFTMWRPEALYGFRLGTTGVDLFFIISGFVIYISLEKAKNSLQFVINRVCRLYPTYWTCVTFTFLLSCILFKYDYKNFEKINFINYIGNMTMFQYYLRIPNIDGPYWTMIIEMLFYIGMCFLFHFNWLKYLNRAGLILSVLIVIITLYYPSNCLMILILKIIPVLPYIPLFFTGIIFYKIYTEKIKLTQKYFILLVCLICQILMFEYSGRSKVFISQMEYAIMLSSYYILFVLFVNRKLHFIITKGTIFLGKIKYHLLYTWYINSYHQTV